jgi:hypothetical protein
MILRKIAANRKLIFNGYTIFISFYLAACTVLQPTRTLPKRETKDIPYNINPQVDSTPKKRMGILPFLDFGKRPEELKLQSQVRFIEEMNRQGQALAFLLNRSELENCMIQNEEYSFKSCASNAQKLGYQVLIEGKILDFKVNRTAETIGIVRKLKTTFEAHLKLRAFSIRSQKEIFNTIKTVTYGLDDIRVAERVTSDQFIESNPELVEKIVVDGFLEFIPQVLKPLEKMNWEGRVAAIQGDKIYLNVGNLSGVQLGDLLRVYDEGPEIFDPELGTSIGKAPGRVKGTLEIVSFFGNDGSVAIVHSGGGFRENDRIELY